MHSTIALRQRKINFSVYICVHFFELSVWFGWGTKNLEARQNMSVFYSVVLLVWARSNFLTSFLSLRENQRIFLNLILNKPNDVFTNG